MGRRLLILLVGGGGWSGKINNTRVFEGDGREDGGIGGEGRAFLVEGST